MIMNLRRTRCPSLSPIFFINFVRNAGIDIRSSKSHSKLSSPIHLEWEDYMYIDVMKATRWLRRYPKLYNLITVRKKPICGLFVFLAWRKLS